MPRKILWTQPPPRGWLLYDADCGFCTRWAWRLALFVGPRGFHLAPLQAPWVRRRLGLSPGELLHELRVLTADDALYGGADALLYLARQIWWAWPIVVLTWLPGMLPLARAAYRGVARRRHCLPAGAARPPSASCALPGMGGHRKAAPGVPHSRPGGA